MVVKRAETELVITRSFTGDMLTLFCSLVWSIHSDKVGLHLREG